MLDLLSSNVHEIKEGAFAGISKENVVMPYYMDDLTIDNAFNDI